MIETRAMIAARLGLVCALAGAAVPEAMPSPSIGAGAVWAPPSGFLASIHAACDAGAGAGAQGPGAFGECFVSQMEKAGASSPALAFTRRTENQGYLREFRETGRVDVACADYPFRANENSVCFLVNGEPAMIDVDDPKMIGATALLGSPVYAGLRKKYPNVAVFPGARDASAVTVAGAPGGDFERLQVSYVLVDGCHACARVGVLLLDFDFDASGHFRGTRVAAVRALPRNP